jgi:enamine deaminase RidA (YjgF/YER057c/UK114 family)
MCKVVSRSSGRLAIIGCTGYKVLSRWTTCINQRRRRIPTPKRGLNHPDLPSPPNFSRGVEVTLLGGRAVFISGAAPTDAGGKVIGKGDMGAQTEACMKKVQAILAEAGGSIDDLAFMTAYVTDIDRIREMDEVRLGFLSGPVLPALSFFEVSQLAHPDWLVEIDGIAIVDEGEETS